MAGRRAAHVVVLGVLGLSCKNDEPAAQDASAPSSPEASPEPSKASSAGRPEHAAREGAAKESKKGGIAGLAKGLIDEAKAVPSDPLGLVPASALVVGQMKVMPLRLVPGWEDLRAAMMRELGEQAGAIDTLRECGLDVDQIEQVTFAILGDEHAMGVVSGPGLGVLKNHECALGKLKTAGHDPDYALVDHEGAKRLVIDDGDAFGYLVGDDTLLVVDKEIDADVAKLRAGEATSVRKGELEVTLGRVDSTKHAWFVARVDGFLEKQMATSGPMAQTQEMWGSAHYDTDLAVAFGTRMPSSVEAEALRDQAQRGLDETKAMLPMFGLPASLPSKVTFAADGDRFTFGLSLSSSECESVRTALKGLM